MCLNIMLYIVTKRSILALQRRTAPRSRDQLQLENTAAAAVPVRKVPLAEFCVMAPSWPHFR